MTRGLSVIDAPQIPGAASLTMPQGGELHLWFWGEGGRPDSEGQERGAERNEQGTLAKLNPHEQGRYERLIPPVAKQHYLAAHAGMQTILGSYLGVPPGQVEWVADAHGKPRLAVPPSTPLHFNLSHSSGCNLLAASGEPVGVDIERIRPLESQQALAGRYYTAAEQQELARLPEQASLERFFAFWTRKEAFVKLLGLGLQGELQSIDVLAVTERGAEVGRTDGSDCCWMSDLVVPGEFRAAVATLRRPTDVTVARLVME